VSASKQDPIAWILRGPHIKRLLLPVGETSALVEVEPLQFFAIVRSGEGANRVSRARRTAW
jgi:hypothetical protein